MKLLLLAVLMAVCAPIHAQFTYQYPIVCTDTKILMDQIEKEFEETLSWNGVHVNDKSVYSLWTNVKTGAWTLLKMTPSHSCVLGVGDASTIRLGDPV